MHFKTVFIPALGSDEKFEQKFKTCKEAEVALDVISNYTLFLQKEEMMLDYSNTGMVLKKVNGEWVEIDGDENQI